MADGFQYGTVAARAGQFLARLFGWDGAAFARIGWTRMSYDRNGKLIETAYSDGRVVSATWGGNCCGKESETSAEGIITVYGYNELKQKVSETKKGFAEDGADDIVTLYTYDINGRVLSTVVTNIASGLGYVESRNAYDAVGRVTNAFDRLGNTTMYSYFGGTSGLRIAPNGVSNLTERCQDGQAKRVLENGVVRQSYAYGVNSDGTRWTLSAQGLLPAAIGSTLELPAFSALELLDFPWSISISDMLGQTIASEKPGFGGTTLIASNSYDNAGNLIATTQYSVESANPSNPDVVSRSLYAYSADGLRLFSALDANTNGVLDLAGQDRLSGTRTAYEKEENIWFFSTYSLVFPEAESAAVITSGVRRVQLTGLGVKQGGGGLLTSLSQALDIRGNVTTTATFVDRDVRKTTQFNTTPVSALSSIRLMVNGLLTFTASSTAVTNTFSNDVLGRQTGVTDGRGNTTTIAYCGAGLVSYTEDAASNHTAYGYDSLGRRTAITE